MLVVKSLEEKGWNVISFYDSPQLSRQVDLTDEAVVKSYFSSTPDVLFYWFFFFLFLGQTN